jgi:hypothetical protein
MCFYNQILWKCGYWKWGHYHQQCYKEDRIGETCGLKLVYEVELNNSPCAVCRGVQKKYRRIDRLSRNIERWRFEGSFPATIERAEMDICDLRDEIGKLVQLHTPSELVPTDQSAANDSTILPLIQGPKLAYAPRVDLSRAGLLRTRTLEEYNTRNADSLWRLKPDWQQRRDGIVGVFG